MVEKRKRPLPEFGQPFLDRIERVVGPSGPVPARIEPEPVADDGGLGLEIDHALDGDDTRERLGLGRVPGQAVEDKKRAGRKPLLPGEGPNDLEDHGRVPLVEQRARRERGPDRRELLRREPSRSFRGGGDPPQVRPEIEMDAPAAAEPALFDLPAERRLARAGGPDEQQGRPGSGDQAQALPELESFNFFTSLLVFRMIR